MFSVPFLLSVNPNVLSTRWNLYEISRFGKSEIHSAEISTRGPKRSDRCVLNCTWFFSASHTTWLLPRVCVCVFFFNFSLLFFWRSEIPNCGICSPPRDRVRLGCDEQPSLWWAEPPPVVQLLFLLAEIRGPTPTHALNMKPPGAAESAPRASTNAQGEYWRTST